MVRVRVHATGAGPAENASRSLGELLGELSGDVRRLVQQEVRLARLQLAEAASGLVRGAGLLGAGASLALAAVLALMAGAIALLAMVLPVWLSALIVAAVLAIGAWLLIRRALGIWRAAQKAPGRMLETAQEDVRWLRTHH